MSIDSGIDTYVRDVIKPMLHSSFSERKALTAWLAGGNVAALDSLGDPNAGAIIGGMNLGVGQRAQSGGKTRKIRYHKDQTDAAAQVDAGGATPTATGFAEDNVGTFGMNFTTFVNAIKIREDSILDVQNGGFSDEMTAVKIAEIVEESVGQGFQRSLENLQSQLWTDTLTSTEQNVDTQVWKGTLGLQHWCSDGASTGETTFTHVGGVDRTTDTELKGNIIDGDGLGSSVPTLRLVRQARLLSTHGAIKKKYAKAGDILITTPDLWDVLANEADGNNQINSNGIPRFARSGFNQDVIQLDDMVIVYDHDCPAGEMYLLTSDFWDFEVQKGENFRISNWVKKHETEEGGERYRWANITAKFRLTCRRPDLQVKFRDMTTS